MCIFRRTIVHMSANKARKGIQRQRRKIPTKTTIQMTNIENITHAR